MTGIELTTQPPKTQETRFARLAARIDTRALLTGAALFALFSALFAFVQFGTSALADAYVLEEATAARVLEELPRPAGATGAA